LAGQGAESLYIDIIMESIYKKVVSS